MAEPVTLTKPPNLYAGFQKRLASPGTRQALGVPGGEKRKREELRGRRERLGDRATTWTCNFRNGENYMELIKAGLRRSQKP
jgi:hypothetical protein